MNSIIKNNLIILLCFFLAFFGCKEKNSLEDKNDHSEAIGLTIYHNGKPYFKVINAQIDSSIAEAFYLQKDTEMLFEVKFIDEYGNDFVPTEKGKSFGWIIDNNMVAEITLIQNEEFKFKAKGLQIGSTLIEFRLNHYDHPDFKTPKVPLVVK